MDRGWTDGRQTGGGGLTDGVNSRGLTRMNTDTNGDAGACFSIFSLRGLGWRRFFTAEDAEDAEDAEKNNKQQK